MVYFKETESEAKSDETIEQQLQTNVPSVERKLARLRSRIISLRFSFHLFTAQPSSQY